MTPQEHKWVETNNSLCAVLRQVHDVLALSPLPPKREWVGLTDEEVQFYRKKYSKLVNAGHDKMTDTNLIAEEFDSIGFYKEVSAALKERNT